MALTALPPAPARTQSSADFSATADTFMAALPGLVTEINLITDPASAIHAATAKTTPVTADEFGIFDSVSLALRKVTWGNIVTTLGSLFAAIAGSSSQVFSVATATADAHAPTYLQLRPQICCSTGATAIADGVTTYLGFGVASTTETDIWFRVPFTGVIRDLSCQSGSVASGTRTYTVMKNGIATAITCASTSTSTQASDTTNTVTVAAGDVISVRLVTSAGSTTTVHNAVYSLVRS